MCYFLHYKQNDLLCQFFGTIFQKDGVLTVQLSLSTNKFDLENLQYSPNPIVNVLNIKSTEVIKNVAVYNILGQEVSCQKVNDSELKLELSYLVSGNYFVKVVSDSKQQVFKVIKK